MDIFRDRPFTWPFCSLFPWTQKTFFGEYSLGSLCKSLAFGSGMLSSVSRLIFPFLGGSSPRCIAPSSRTAGPPPCPTLSSLSKIFLTFQMESKAEARWQHSESGRLSALICSFFHLPLVYPHPPTHPQKKVKPALLLLRRTLPELANLNASSLFLKKKYNIVVYSLRLDHELQLFCGSSCTCPWWFINNIVLRTYSWALEPMAWLSARKPSWDSFVMSSPQTTTTYATTQAMSIDTRIPSWGVHGPRANQVACQIHSPVELRS